jgi:UDP-GlcNAc:undecaprenyl-phosphate/decaprenyl-phosphate GlcNAc-1-phosphate transferase
LSQYLFVFMTALSTALIMVPFLRKWAFSTGTVDVPDERKVHTTAVPRIGGIAIFMAFIFSLLVYADLQPTIRGILAGALIVFFTGFVDDLYCISPRRKFLGEIGGCLVTMAVGHLYLSNLGNLFGFGAIVLPLWLAIPFTVFAIVGVINAVNLIDGLDGLAGGVAVIALAAFFILARNADNVQAMLVCAALLGALLGFLKYNYYPACIFMGDTGSLVLGFLLGFLALLLTQGSGNAVSPVLPVLILGVPIIDTLWVMTSRLLKGRSPFSPDKTHVHHKFLDLGLEHRFTVILIYSISLFWALASLLLQRLPEYLLLLLFLAVTSSFYLILRHVLHHPERFPILNRDSSGGLRHSETYARFAAVGDRLLPLLFALYLVYLGGGMLYGCSAYGVSWAPFALLLLAGPAALVWKRDHANPLILTWLYLGTILLVFNAEPSRGLHSAAAARFSLFSDLIFWGIGMLLGFKVMFRKDGEFFISGVDLLCLGLLVFTGVLLSNFGSSPQLFTTLFKSLLLVATLKICRGCGPSYRHAALAVTHLGLLVGLVLTFG